MFHCPGSNDERTFGKFIEHGGIVKSYVMVLPKETAFGRLERENLAVLHAVQGFHIWYCSMGH